MWRNNFVEILVGAFIVISGVAPGREVQGQSARVIEGKDTEPHSYPSMLLGEPLCGEHPVGGVLLSPEWVLTSAVNAVKLFGAYWYGGRHDQCNGTEAAHSEYSLDEAIYPHPGFTKGSRKDDISVWKLENGLNLSDIVQIAAIATDDFPMPKNAKIVGWGVNNLTSHLDPCRLLDADGPIGYNSMCEKLWKAEGETKYVFNNSVCAGLFNGTNACLNELGSPLYAQVEEGKQNVVVGILSVPGCLPTTDNERWKSIVSVYTRVAKYIGWIESTTGLKFEPHGNSGYGFFKESPKSQGGDPKQVPSKKGTQPREGCRNGGSEPASGNNPASSQIQTSAVLKLAAGLAQSLCSQTESYGASKILPPAMKKKPATSSALQCARFQMQKCDVSSCMPLNFLKC